MDQQLKLLAVKLDDLDSICNTNGGKRKLTPKCCSLPPAHASWHVNTFTYVYAHTCALNNNNKLF